MYVPNMAYTAAGPITSAATNFVRVAFSEPIAGLDITQFNVTLTPAPDSPAAAAPATAARRLLQVGTQRSLPQGTSGTLSCHLWNHEHSRESMRNAS